MRTVKVILAITVGLVALGLATASSLADDLGQQLQSTLTKVAPSIVSVRIVLAMKYTSKTGQSADHDAQIDLQGYVVEPDGLVAISALSFSKEFRDRISPNADSQMNVTTTPTDFKVTVPGDPTEHEATLVATDTILGIAFLKIYDLGTTQLQAIDFTAGANPAIGDNVLVLSRLGKGYDYAPYFSQTRINGIISKPRKAFNVDGGQGSNMAPGAPVFDTSGDPIGIMTIVPAEVADDSEEQPELSGVSSIELFVIPASNVAEAVSQAKARENTPAPAPPSTAPPAPAKSASATK